MNMMIKGYTAAGLVLVLFAFTAFDIRNLVSGYVAMNNVMYYWFCFTVLTGVWEFFYVTLYEPITAYAEKLKQTDTHVWTTDYRIMAILPHNTAKIFYAEYGAHADREYMSRSRGDFWGRLIESSHALFCGLFCLGSLLATYHNRSSAATWLAGASMGSQFMNSLLYMGQYFLECNSVYSPNYNCPAFPLGKFMMKRWFMWVNLAWLLFPVYIIYTALTHNMTGVLCAPLALLHFVIKKHIMLTESDDKTETESDDKTETESDDKTETESDWKDKTARMITIDQALVDYYQHHLNPDELFVIVYETWKKHDLSDLSTNTRLSMCDIYQLYYKIFCLFDIMDPEDPEDRRYIWYQRDPELVNLLTTGNYDLNLEDEMAQIRNGTCRLSMRDIMRFTKHHLTAWMI